MRTLFVLVILTVSLTSCSFGNSQPKNEVSHASKIETSTIVTSITGGLSEPSRNGGSSSLSLSGNLK